MKAEAKRKPQKTKTKRVLLGDALRAAMGPQLRGYGFEPASKELAKYHLTPRAYAWVRRRGPYEDFIGCRWEKYGAARFYIDYLSDQPGIKLDLNGSVPTAPTYRFRRFGFNLFGHAFGRGDIDRTVSLAQLRLAEIDLYLRTMELSPNLDWAAWHEPLWYWRRVGWIRMVIGALIGRRIEPR